MNNDDTNPQPTKPQTPPASAFGSDRKVFDVMRPGKAPASPTSRPVVIGHKPQVHDDQLVPSADTRYASENPLDEKRDLLTHKGGVDFASTAAADEYPDDPPGEGNPLPADTAQADAAKEPDAMDVAGDPPAGPTDTKVPSDPSASYASPVPEGADEKTVPNDTDETKEPDTAASEAASEEQSAASTSDSSDVADNMPDEPAATPVNVSADSAASSAPDEAAAPSVWPEQSSTAPAAPSTPAAPETGQNTKPNADADVDELPQLGPDDVVAATGAPVIDHSFVVHHKTRTKWWEWLLIVVLIIILAAATLNLLLDAQIIKTNLNIPHTHLIKS